MSMSMFEQRAEQLGWLCGSSEQDHSSHFLIPQAINPHFQNFPPVLIRGRHEVERFLNWIEHQQPNTQS